jgi:hypothetical protein
VELLAVALALDALALHQRLHAVERLSRDERLMGATMHLAEPPKVPDVLTHIKSHQRTSESTTSSTSMCAGVSL